MKLRRRSHLTWLLWLGAAMTGAFVAQRGSADAPPGRYTIEAAQAVRDNATGLVWQQSVAPTVLGFDAARAYCEERAPAGSWRVPSVKELQTIVDYSMQRAGDVPMIDASAFPGTPTMPPTFWTSSVYPTSTDLLMGYLVNFMRGNTGWQTRDEAHHVRCVR